MADQPRAAVELPDDGVAHSESSNPISRRSASGSLAAAGLSGIGLVAVFVGLAASRAVTTPLLFGAGMVVLALGLGAGARAQGLRRREAGVAGYAGPSPVLVFGSAAAAGIGIQALVLLITGDSGLPDAIALVLSSAITAACALVAIAALVVRPGALRWHDMGLRRPGPGASSAVLDVAWGAALAVPVLTLAGMIAVTLVGILGVAPAPVVPLSPDPAVLVASLVAATVVAPIWEELFFRGFATTAWARAAGGRAAIVRGAVFFALVHVLTAWVGDPGSAAAVAVIAFTVRLPVGLVLGWIFLRRGTVLAPIALHATYNAVPILLYAASVSTLSGA
jgi:CAAX protease family protein